VDFEVALQRAERRDAELFGSSAAVRDRYLRRYFPAQRHYLETVRPKERADVVIQNDGPECAEIVRRYETKEFLDRAQRRGDVAAHKQDRP
jgi:hypothetical protein